MNNSVIFKKVLFVIAILLFYRLGVNVTVPFINYENLVTGENLVFSLLAKFSGGASSKLSIFSLGVLPYITALIAIHVFTLFIPFYKQLKEAGGMGEEVLNKHIFIFSLLLSFSQAYGLVQLISSNAVAPIVYGKFDVVSTSLTMTLGTMILVYLSSLITKYGIGNGITLMITCSIVSGMFSTVLQFIESYTSGGITKITILLFISIFVLTLIIVSLVEESVRKIPVFDKSGGVATRGYYPIKINISGIMPVIIVYMLMGLVFFVSTNFNIYNEFFNIYFTRGTVLYYLFFVTTTIIFSYLYTLAMYNPKKIVKDFKDRGLFIPTIEQGEKTLFYIKKVILTITLFSSVYLILISLLIDYATELSGVGASIAGTSLVILVMFSIEVKNHFNLLLTNRKYKTINKKIDEVFE